MNAMLVAASILVAAPAPKEDPKKDSPTIVGVWIVQSSVMAGKNDPPPAGTTMSFTKEGKCISKEGGTDIGDESNYRVDATKSPAHFDMIEMLGNKQLTMSGIYKVEGDTLTICIAIKGDRPTEFVSAAGKTNVLITLKRAKKEKK